MLDAGRQPRATVGCDRTGDGLGADHLRDQRTERRVHADAPGDAFDPRHGTDEDPILGVADAGVPEQRRLERQARRSEVHDVHPRVEAPRDSALERAGGDESSDGQALDDADGDLARCGEGDAGRGAQADVPGVGEEVVVGVGRSAREEEREREQRREDPARHGRAQRNGRAAADRAGKSTFVAVRRRSPLHGVQSIAQCTSNFSDRETPALVYARVVSDSVLVVDDDAALRTVLVGLLRQGGYAARAVASGEEALRSVAAEHVDVVVTDLRMPGMDGLALVAALAKQAPDLPVIMISAHGTVPVAVEAMKAGAKEFLLKPFDKDDVLATVARVLETHGRTSAPPMPPPVVAPDGGSRSEAMRDCRERMARAARSTATVLLRGESGCGKEVAARWIHGASAHGSGPFVPVHCAALPDTLLESELFGYEKGAFTGATKRKPGRVELAAGGTLFLDEIGDVSPAVQVKLLRLLQEKEFQRLGSETPETINLRFIAATHRDLEAMVRAGTFREDLFYRLAVVPIELPPLRDRRADIAELARGFCERSARDNGRTAVLGDDALALLEAQPWPGNVRELQSFVERVVVFSDAAVIGAADVQRELERSMPRTSSASSKPAAGTLHESRGAAERRAIEEALERARGNRTLAARLLGVSRRTLYNKLAELGM